MAPKAKVKRGPGNFAKRATNAVRKAGFAVKPVALDPKKDFDKPVRRRATAKNLRLPGMEDAPIKDLEEAAIEHSDCLSQIREQREELKRIDERLATLMKKLGKKTFNHGGITLKLREGQEKVSVKVKRHDAEDKQDEAPAQTEERGDVMDVA